MTFFEVKVADFAIKMTKCKKCAKKNARKTVYCLLFTVPSSLLTAFIIHNYSTLKKGSWHFSSTRTFRLSFLSENHSRAHHLRHQHRALVDDVVGIFETSVTNFLVLVAVITHNKVHEVITYVHRIQQLSVTLGDGHFVLVY